MTYLRKISFIINFTLIAPLAALPIHDVSQVEIGNVQKIYTPQTIEELSSIVKNATTPISIAGGRFSQGGHIWHENGIVIDMIQLNKITALDIANKKITVQGGISWQEIQKVLDICNLSVLSMQSYNNFTVGGSLSVNVHGRDIRYGQIIETVESITLMLYDGSLVHASRNENYDLFKAAIGGYGAFGIIVEATLVLTENTIIERRICTMKLNDYLSFFKNHVHHQSAIALHNANIYPPDFNQVVSVAWHYSTEPLTITEKLQPVKKIHLKETTLSTLLRYIPFLQRARPTIEQKLIFNRPEVVWRNYEMSTSAETLEPLTRSITTPVLQEYFIPCDRIDSFMDAVKNISSRYKINILNISIRFVPANNESLLSYAAHADCFSFVFYINITNSTNGLEYAQTWTRELIDATLAIEGGSFYMPYQKFATKDQVEKAYPRIGEFKALKKRYDPYNRFSNTFLAKYIA